MAVVSQHAHQLLLNRHRQAMQMLEQQRPPRAYLGWVVAVVVLTLTEPG